MDKEKTLYTAKKSSPANSTSPKNKSSNTHSSKKFKQNNDDVLAQILDTSNSEIDESYDDEDEEESEDDSNKKRKKKEKQEKQKISATSRPATPDMFADSGDDEGVFQLHQ